MASSAAALAMAAIPDAACADPAVKVGHVYEVSANGRVGYVLASMHGRSPFKIELKDELAAIIAAADVVAFETIPDGSGRRADHARVTRDLVARARRGPRLTQEIGDALAARVMAVIEQRGGSEDHWNSLARAKVQFAPLVLDGIAGALLRANGEADPWRFPGIDRLVLDEARRAGRPVEELEGAVQVMRHRARLSRDEAAAALEQLVERLETDPHGAHSDAYAETMMRWLFAGEPEVAYQLFRERTCGSRVLEQVCDKLVDDRNAYLAARIDALISSSAGRSLAVIGAMHAAGPRSVLLELLKRGYTVRAMP